MDDVIGHIQCEIHDAIEELKADRHVPLADFKYVAFIDLTLTNHQGLTPTLEIIRPFQAEGLNITRALNAQATA